VAVTNSKDFHLIHICNHC